ncbi:MAG TPA: competence protein CoiA family protein [Cyclobacteriaceae bacterium]|nr:competence protein CoiA family protein [Cyclobacteriaceae bacterium]
MNGNKIMATDPAWDHRKEEYRALCNEKAVCPICQERIICKFGEINQHHFAHHHNTDCPGSHDNEEHMTGKAILYGFLMARYGHEATVDLEYYIPELKTTCDLLVQFQDGRKWAVEFYCGGKAQALRDKINYYEEQNILTSWLLSQQLCKDNSSEKTVIISARDKLLIDKTGIDKYYIGEWYKRIVINRQRTDLPLDGSSEGTLMYLDVEQKELRIFRALQSEYHHQ